MEIIWTWSRNCCLLRANAHLKWTETKWKWKWQWNSRTVEQATVLHEIRMGLLIPLPFLSPTSSSSSPQFPYVCRLLLKHEGMLDSGKHGPVPTFFLSFYFYFLEMCCYHQIQIELILFCGTVKCVSLNIWCFLCFTVCVYEIYK